MSLCLGVSVPEAHKVASLFLDKILCSPLISKLFAVMKHNFRCLQHNTMYMRIYIPVDMYFTPAIRCWKNVKMILRSA